MCFHAHARSGPGGAAVHQARLEDEWAYLFLDGVSLRVRRPAGHRPMVCFVKVERAWTELFTPSCSDSTSTGKTAPSSFLHKRLDITVSIIRVDRRGE